MDKKYYDCLVAAGTTEAHEAIEEILINGKRVLATVATELGAEVLKDLACPFLDIEVGRKTEDEFVQLIQDTKVGFVIDATHPFATEVTRTLKRACDSVVAKHNPLLKYIRFVRENMDYLYENIIWVKDANQAAKYLNQLDGNFLLTTGANTVHIYKDEIVDFNHRGYVRVLDTKASIDKCNFCGVDKTHVIAKNPPFSEADNDALISQLNIKAMVSKDSGLTGGLPEKIASAKKVGIPVILIERPVSEQGIGDRNQLIKCILDKDVMS